MILRLILMAVSVITIPILSRFYWETAKGLFLGSWICASGAIMNFLAVAFNGWQMPVEGVAYIPAGVIWKVAVNPRLPWIIDRFPYGSCTYSVGDACIYAGGLLFSLALIYRIGRGVWAILRPEVPIEIDEKKIDNLFKEWNQ